MKNLTGAKTLAFGALGLAVSFLTAREEHTNKRMSSPSLPKLIITPTETRKLWADGNKAHLTGCLARPEGELGSIGGFLG